MFLSVVILGGFTTETPAMAHSISADTPPLLTPRQGIPQFILKQLACRPPTIFAKAVAWQNDLTLADWVRAHILELSYTSWRLKPYAEELGDYGPPFHWIPERRAMLRADLDAAFLHVYGLDREEAEHVLDSFVVARKY